MAAHAFDIGQTQDRYVRYVRRARLCVDAHAPAHRLAFTTEEALRLASLPGENEGRSYYFRRLRVTGLPASGDRRAWLEKFQRALEQQAARAIHGSEARAASAEVVYFRGETEALEILLDRILARRTVHEWFWPMVMGGRAVSAGGGTIVEIVERLRARPASWVAVAAALFAAPEFDAVRLLEAIPEAMAEGWLLEMTGSPRWVAGGATPQFARLVLPGIEQALRIFGFASARVVWLAALAILYDSPAELATGTAVRRARQALERIAERGAAARAELPIEPAAAQAPLTLQRIPTDAKTRNAPRQIAENGMPENADEPSRAAELSASTMEPADPASPAAYATDAPASDSAARITQPESPHERTSTSVQPAAYLADATSPPTASAERTTPSRWYCSGLPTDAAGFFFLLNALGQVGVAEALAAGLGQAGPDFTVRVLLRLAAHAGVAQDDPISIWLDSLLTDAGDGGGELPCDESCWPLNLRPSREAASIDYIVRVWYLGVRRWCWRAARISLRDIVERPGVFTVNRTDLDVSLALEQADVRVRKAGLDLDPGWLPWFGRVVRFHYLFRGEFHG